jgi:hypothetical protein
MSAPRGASAAMASDALLDLPGHDAMAGPERGILAWLAEGRARFGDRPAVRDLSGRPPLSHAGLHDVASA